MSKNFTATCNLLSQYIKEKGRSLGDLALIGKNDTYRAPITMSLLPGVDVSGDDTKENVSDRNATNSMDQFPQRAGFHLQAPPAAENREPKKSPLTIFYGGKVLVFDNFPADKAKDLMMLAGNGSGIAKNTGVAPSASVAPTAKPSVTAPNIPLRPAQAIASADLPIARKALLHQTRKASLHQFLQKRKDRINARAPYQAKKETPPSIATRKMEENQPWLGLKPSLSSECSR